MAKIWSLAAQKGGVGKSTLALNICASALRAGIRAAVVDIDPQQTITKLSQIQGGAVPITDFERASEYDLILIDTPGWHSGEVLNILSRSDFVLIPATPGIVDALSVAQTWRDVEGIGIPAASRIVAGISILVTNFFEVIFFAVRGG